MKRVQHFGAAVADARRVVPRHPRGMLAPKILQGSVAAPPSCDDLPEDVERQLGPGLPSGNVPGV